MNAYLFCVTYFYFVKMMERTLAIVKPDAFEQSNEIENDIQTANFTILAKKNLLLTKEQVGDFYIEHVGKSFYDDLLDYMSSDTCCVMVLEAPKAISSWRQIMGPTDVNVARQNEPNSIRARYGLSTFQNAVHGSDSFASAEREIHFFFPEMDTLPVSDQVREYLAKEINPTLIIALAEMCRSQPADPVLWLAAWLKENNPSRKA